MNEPEPFPPAAQVATWAREYADGKPGLVSLERQCWHERRVVVNDRGELDENGERCCPGVAALLRLDPDACPPSSYRQLGRLAKALGGTEAEWVAFIYGADFTGDAARLEANVKRPRFPGTFRKLTGEAFGDRHLAAMRSGVEVARILWEDEAP